VKRSSELLVKERTGQLMISTRFPQAKPLNPLQGPLARRKSLSTKYLDEAESLRQAKENNTTFIFWLLHRRILGDCSGKVGKSVVSG
jgi:hypothetical protein